MLEVHRIYHLGNPQIRCAPEHAQGLLQRSRSVVNPGQNMVMEIDQHVIYD